MSATLDAFNLLTPLPKAHGWRELDSGQAKPDYADRLAVLTRRICVHRSLPFQHWTGAQMTTLMGANPNVKVGIIDSPWHNGFKGWPGNPSVDPTDTTDDAAYLATLSSELQAIIDGGVSASNVATAYLDTERFASRQNTEANAAWNNALRAKFDAVTAVYRAKFPNIHINYYGDGAYWPDASHQGWGLTTWSISPGYVSDAIYGDSRGVPLYYNTDLWTTQFGAQKAAAMIPSEELIYWMPMGYSIKPTINTDLGVEAENSNTDDLYYPYWWGAKFNTSWYSAETNGRRYRFVPPCREVMLWERPNNANWCAWFQKYCEGAAA